MKLNIFSVHPDDLPSLEEKFESVGLELIHEGEQCGWRTQFYFSRDAEPTSIPWMNYFSDFLGERDFFNLTYFAAYVFQKGERCFTLTYGKSHFYVRPHCDHDFGIELAKRIANENDVKQTASKKFAGKKKKEIKSYASNTPLNIESGESVDYLRAAIESQANELLGSSGKFGSSILVNAPVGKSEIGELLDNIVSLLAEGPKFKLPRTTVITDEDEVKKYDSMLLAAIVSDEQLAEFTHSGHEVVGVDFVFSGHERFTLSCRGHKQRDLGDAELDIKTLRAYIASEGIRHDEIFNVRIRVDNDGHKPYSKSLRDALDFIVEGENVLLSQGRWVYFNEDYIDQLNESLDSISIEPTESELQKISMKEGDFNGSELVKGLGYVSADKDFSKVKTKLSTQIEAWDLHRDGTVYAVKFGSAQTLGYVCDQANNILEIVRNNANKKKLNQNFSTYCLWFGFERVKVPAALSSINSIIFKQKVDAWARRCRDLGVEPTVKFSLRERPAEASEM